MEIFHLHILAHRWTQHEFRQFRLLWIEFIGTDVCKCEASGSGAFTDMYQTFCQRKISQVLSVTFYYMNKATTTSTWQGSDTEMDKR